MKIGPLNSERILATSLNFLDRAVDILYTYIVVSASKAAYAKKALTMVMHMKALYNMETG